MRLVELLRNPEYARQIGLQGLRYVTSEHGWSDVANKYEDLYSTVIERSR